MWVSTSLYLFPQSQNTKKQVKNMIIYDTKYDMYMQNMTEL